MTEIEVGVVVVIACVVVALLWYLSSPNLDDEDWG